MSLATLHDDERYQALDRALRDQPLHIADPALADGRVGERLGSLVDQMRALAIEHGWDDDAKRWTR